MSASTANNPTVRTPVTSGTTSAVTSPLGVRPRLRSVGGLRLLAGPHLGDHRVRVERRLPVDPVQAGLGQHHETRAAAGAQHRGPIGAGDLADVVEQVFGQATGVQRGARAAAGRPCAAGSASGWPPRTAAGGRAGRTALAEPRPPSRWPRSASTSHSAGDDDEAPVVQPHVDDRDHGQRDGGQTEQHDDLPALAIAAPRPPAAPTRYGSIGAGGDAGGVDQARGRPT